MTPNPLTRWTKIVIGALRHLNGELLGAGKAIERSNRFPQPDPAETKRVRPAPAGQVPTGA